MEDLVFDSLDIDTPILIFIEIVGEQLTLLDRELG
jgi:hypothetical protein